MKGGLMRVFAGVTYWQDNVREFIDEMVHVTYFFIQFSPTFLKLDLVSSLPTIDNTTIDFAVVAGLVARWRFRSTVGGGDVAIVFVVVAISVANFDGIGPKMDQVQQNS